MKKSKVTYPGLNNSSIGAVGELKVCADLLIKGYEVFRAMSPSSSCDILALKNGRILRIEVRTARKIKTGEIQFPGTLKDVGRSDHFAAVGRNEIHYFPPLETI